MALDAQGVIYQDRIENYFVEMFLESHKKAPQKIVLDLDNTDDPLHGNQEGRFFHGYYDHYCYLPLYIFCEDHLLASVLRTAFKTFSYRTHKRGSKKRKMVGKAEYMKKCIGMKRYESARFIVTSLPHEEGLGQYLYEEIYCSRGDMENRIK